MKETIKAILAMLILRGMFVWLVAVFWYAPSKKEQAYDVIAHQFSMTHYLMDVERFGGVADQETVDAIQERIDTACFMLIGRDDPKRCSLAVCFNMWVPFNSCLE